MPFTPVMANLNFQHPLLQLEYNLVFFIYILNVFTVNFDQFKAFLLNKRIILKNNQLC